jgi:oxidase EvaA
VVSAPYINQPEVGILGIAISQRNGERAVLLDAKFEPGNVHGVDVAPSFQATKSNFERAHGGVAPALSEHFLVSSRWHSNVKQSEQGTRFITKWNENVILLDSLHDVDDISRTMRWHSVADVRRLLLTSHTLNTDARSVIATSDWSLWLTPDGFSPDSMSPYENSDFARSLRESLDEPSRENLTQIVSAVLSDWSNRNPFTVRESPLVIDGNVVRVISSARPSGTHVIHVHVATDSRENSDWDQPLIGNPHSSEEILLFSIDGHGNPRFFFTPHTEVGLAGAQLGNSVTSADPGRANPLVLPSKEIAGILATSALRAEITQSDEGGRFHRQLVTYSIRHVDNMNRPLELAPEGLWLSAREISDLARLPGYFTNEARTAISMIVGLA